MKESDIVRQIESAWILKQKASVSYRFRQHPATVNVEPEHHRSLKILVSCFVTYQYVDKYLLCSLLVMRRQRVHPTGSFPLQSCRWLSVSVMIAPSVVLLCVLSRISKSTFLIFDQFS